MKKYIITLLLVCCALILNIVRVDASEVIEETNETLEDISISLTLDRDHYNLDEEIVLIINNVTIEEEPIYQYNEEGLKVIDTNITNDNTILKVRKDNIDPKATLEIIVTINNKDYYINVYSYYDNRYGVFLSRQSYDDAFEKYNEYLLNNSYITKEEYISIREKHYSQYAKVSLPTKVITSRNRMSLMSEASDSVRVSGTITWKDDWGTIHPCRDIKVEIWNKNAIIDTKVGEDYTNENGFYTYTFDNGTFLENGGYDIYLKVYPSGEGVSVVDASDDNYYHSTIESVISNVTSGEIYSGYDVLFEMDSDMEKAFQISQAAIIASKYAQVMNENSPYGIEDTIDDVKVVYPYDDGDGELSNDNCFYDSDKKTINIIGDAISENQDTPSDLKPYAAWDVIMHEYGHHIQHVFDITENPGLVHYSGDNMADHYYEHALGISNCQYCEETITRDECKRKGIRLAWAEGWATYFAFAAQDYYRTSLNNIRYIEPCIYNYYTGGLSDLNTTISFGEACEGTTVSFLYNLYDSNNNSWDTFALGHQAIWNYSMHSSAKTLSQFLNYLLNNNVVNDEDMWKLLEEYQLAPWPYNEVAATLNELPTLNWYANGGSIYFPNDLFTLVIEDASGNEILRKTGLTTTSYTLTEEEWNQLLAISGSYFNWRVEGYCVKDEMTGPYGSNWFTKGKPTPTGTLTEGTSISGTITSSIDYKWYKFTAPTTGTYEFYTIGSVDTYGQIYNSLAYADTTYNLIANASNDNGGTDNNCSVEIDLTSGQTVYFKVKSVNNSTGSFTVSVHKHSYVYQWLDLIKHNKTCSCEETVQEGHVVSSDSYNSGASTAPCLLCGGNATIGFIEIQNNIIKISENGSFILSSGLVVLVDEDIESYMNGTLVFRNNDEDIM